MMTKLVFLAALLAAVTAAKAQQPPAPVSPAKKELVAKVLQLQQPGIEAMARSMVEQPVAQMMQQVNLVLRQRVPADKRETLAREIQADMKKYIDEITPTVRERAVKLAPSTVGAVLEEKLSEDELRQVISMLESPVNRKFQALAGEMQRAIAEKLVAETRGVVGPKVQALEQSVSKRLAPYSGAASAPTK